MNTHHLRQDINNFCNTVGKDPLLVQGAGGNVSYKIADELWVKASGTSLAEAREKNIFVPVDLELIKNHIQANNFSFKPSAKDNTELRPSIETLLHALMPQKIVVHLHAIEILSYLVRKDVGEINKKIPNINSAFVEYLKPGADLAKAIFFEINKKQNVNVIFMKNHGIVFAADSMAEINKILIILLDSFKPKVFSEPQSGDIIIKDNPFKEIGYKQSKNKKIHLLATKPIYLNRLIGDWALCPDHVVFLGDSAELIFNEDEIDNLYKRDAPLPPYIFYIGVGVFESPNLNNAQEEQLLCYCELLFRQQSDEKLDSLSLDQVNDLLNWDAEKYRRKLLNL